MYNKRKYLKANDKKVLHKVKKQWITISLALLMAIGGGVAATHISANADTANNPATTVQTKPSTNQDSNNSNIGTKVTNQAKNLHTQLLNNAPTKDTNTPHNLGEAAPDLHTGNYYGLNYRYDSNNKALEFTNGNLTWNGNSSWHGFLGAFNNTNPLFAAKSIKFDDGVNTSNLTDMRNMFATNTNIQNIDFGNSFDTSHVNDMQAMFQSDSGLQSINFGNKFNMSNVNDVGQVFNHVNSLQEINIAPNAIVKFDPSAELRVTLYKALPNNQYSNSTANFNQLNTGKFVSRNLIDNTNILTNPNQYIANNTPYLTTNQWNQNYHFNNPQGNNNDIESIIPHYNNGKVDYYDVYYIWNPDPQNPGAQAFGEWAYVKTNNLGTFQSIDPSNPVSLKTVAIPNPAYELNGHGNIEAAPNNTDPIPWHQVAGGSIISNHKQDGGTWLNQDQFGNAISPNARLAYFANYNPDNSGCYLAYANPDGKGGYQQFHPYSENNVFTGDIVGVGKRGDFRDPSVSVNPINPNQLVAYCAGGGSKKVYILTSNNAINWHYSGFVDVSHITNHSIETPDVYEINNTPILFFSAQDTGDGEEQIAYVTGHYNNNGFFQIDANSKSGNIDNGTDIYAGNFAKLDNNHLFFIGWLNNWAYFDTVVVDHDGGFTMPRIISWNGNCINVTPVEAGQPAGSDKVNGNIYNPDGKISVDFNTPVNNFDLKLNRANDDNNYVDFSFNNGNLNIHRNGSAKGAFNTSKSVNIGTNQLSNIEFYVDNDSIEAYLPEIHKIYSVIDYDNTHNTPYVLTGAPTQAKVSSYKFNLNQTPTIANLNNILSNYSADKAQLNQDLKALGNHTNSSLDNSKNLLSGYFNTIQSAINNAQENISKANNYNGDVRQHAFVALANNDMDNANIKLYQASIQLDNLNNAATPYIDASEADTRIANYYKNSVANSVAKANQQTAKNAAHAADENIINQQKASVANSVNAANQQKANQAAQQADQRIAQQQRTSVTNSVAAANKAKANQAAQVADQNILNKQKESVANSVNAANQRTATSAANSANQSIENSIANSYAQSADNSIVTSYRNSASASVSAANSSYAKTAAGKAAAKSGASSADKSIESFIASSYAKSADTSIANSYKNSVNASVTAANQSKANSAAQSANTSIANSYKNSVSASVSSTNQSKANSTKASADQSIENSEEAKNAQNSTPASQSTPVTPINPTPVMPTFNSVVTPSSEASVSNSSVASSTVMPTSESTPESSASHQVTKPVTHHSNTHKIALNGVNKRAYFTSKHYEAKFTPKIRKNAIVLEATVKSNHSVAYKLQIGKHVGYVYGYLTKLAKPSFMNKKNAYIHVGKRAIKIHSKKFGYIRINKATQYNNRNYIKYDVTFGKKHGVMYGSLPVVKRAKKVANSKYYQSMPKHYHYAKVIKPLQMYSKKNFSKRTRKGAISKGITVRIKRVVKVGKFTRFELSNGKFITGLKSFSKLIK